MSTASSERTVGLLLSGGLDSCVLLGHLLAQGCVVQPFYVCCRLAWEREERAAAAAFLAAVASSRLRPLVTFQQPVDDLYGPHWSVTGRGAPQADTPDEAVYLHGRNALLLIKPALWCAVHQIRQLALALLANNPFDDAAEGFFHDFAAALSRATGSRLQFIRPLAPYRKAEVLSLVSGLPLELTFSCIAPHAGRHCGRCNKCAERRAAFAAAGIADKTDYVQ